MGNQNNKLYFLPSKDLKLKNNERIEPIEFPSSLTSKISFQSLSLNKILKEYLFKNLNSNLLIKNLLLNSFDENLLNQNILYYEKNLKNNEVRKNFFLKIQRYYDFIYSDLQVNTK